MTLQVLHLVPQEALPQVPLEAPMVGNIRPGLLLGRQVVTDIHLVARNIHLDPRRVVANLRLPIKTKADPSLPAQAAVIDL